MEDDDDVSDVLSQWSDHIRKISKVLFCEFDDLEEDLPRLLSSKVGHDSSTSIQRVKYEMCKADWSRLRDKSYPKC